MDESLELEGAVAATLRSEATERGFADAEAYLRWIVDHRERLFDEPDDGRLDRIERRLDRLEAAVEGGSGSPPAEPDDGRSGSPPAEPDDGRDITDVIDDALGDPEGADDETVATAISSVEGDGDGTLGRDGDGQ